MEGNWRTGDGVSVSSEQRAVCSRQYFSVAQLFRAGIGKDKIFAELFLVLNPALKLDYGKASAFLSTDALNYGKAPC